MFGDAVLDSAIVDRIVYHSDILKIPDKNYRMKELTISKN
ncbi:ATP-binding protein [Flexistipes sinusarabici]|nr:ATP-binding protein [Flexistipes sinusarabici]